MVATFAIVGILKVIDCLLWATMSGQGKWHFVRLSGIIRLLLAAISFVAGVVMAVESVETVVSRLAIAMMVAFFASTVYQLFAAYAHFMHTLDGHF